MNLLKELDGNDFRNYLRMDEMCFMELLSKIKPQIDRKNTVMRECVSAEERLVVTLRYLATGRSLEDLKYSAAISPQLLSRIIPETCEAIYNSLKEYRKLPTCEEEWKEVEKDFRQRWNFDHAVGAVDGKHIAVQKPPHSGSLYYNYKKFFSKILFAIVNAKYEFMYVNAGTNGCVSDATILNNSRFYKKLSNNSLHLPLPSPLPGTNNSVPYVFLGDSAFGLNKHFMKPYPLKNISHDERIFNYRLSRARRVVENAFGISASRFRVFHQAISLSVEKVDIIILACCVLHNFLLNKNQRYVNESSFDREDVDNISFQQGEWRQLPSLVPLCQSTTRERYEEGNRVRHIFTRYFNNEGRVTFQEQMIRVGL
ncbi:putative nuclease HARBI1 [Ischnura elegans]|uniref:putative nuclease HARBI1 n=1 Tax=Ischnura elegans TaxID=197161 RepID=UPI001ED8BFA2|nr:putative nuclease HARBI1 [Ischnura elegans]XP_046386857.1 putative nuclease HARBI1 [Ischnura elegans]